MTRERTAMNGSVALGVGFVDKVNERSLVAANVPAHEPFYLINVPLHAGLEEGSWI